MNAGAIRIFIAEDSDADVYLIQEALRNEKLSFELERHADGEDALRALMAMSALPQIIILDLNLPGIAGMELLRYIRGEVRYQAVPVMVFTSSDRPTDRVAAEAAGADLFITKPTTLDDFLSCTAAGVRKLARPGCDRGASCGSWRGRRPSPRRLLSRSNAPAAATGVPMAVYVYASGALVPLTRRRGALATSNRAIIS